MSIMKHIPIPSGFTVSRNIRRFNMAENDRKIFFSFNLFSIFIFALPIIYMYNVNYKMCEENNVIYNKLKHTGIKQFFISVIKNKKKNICVCDFVLNMIINSYEQHKWLSICEYENLVTLDQNNIIIDEIYSKIYKIINSILYIHFCFMKNPFSYFFHYCSISVDQLGVSCNGKNERLNKSKGNNLKRLYLLKDTYFNLYIMLYQLKTNKSNSCEENEKENVYKSIRQIFKVKYKNDYKMMRTDIIFIWYLLKSYLFLLFYKKVIKKNNKLICLQNHEYIGSVNISQTNKDVATLLIDSLILLKSDIQNGEQANIIYESVHKKLYDSINLVKGTKKIIENEMKKGKEVKSQKIENMVEHTPIKEHVDDQSDKLNNSPPIIDNEVYKTSDLSYYHIYYCVNKEIETKNSYINSENIENGKNISTYLNECNEKPASNTNPSIIQNQHEHVTYKNCLDKKYDENYKLMCVQNMVNELKDKYKKQKNKEYIYVEKKLYYDDKCNDFSIKHISSNDSILSNKKNVHVKNNDYNKCNMDIYTNTKYVTPNNTQNIYQFENKNNSHNDNNESSNPSLLIPIKDPKAFRKKITMALKQRGGNLGS
ncbi:conserved Plasmodium protein, unknown function [Plasmodium vinckei brucechwatti]|uniref:Uncharacterized protein n=1 Tax=Plasmodium vinckei brucechwatti TaxID=119398 RepID=A0A6V7T288_PLAVN|nr:conserved Plasmodium protein, unknown function [Plasmodium vinckei brucechwatti]